MKILIQSIPHRYHRYETVGDYWTESNGDQHLRVSQMSDTRYEFLVILHELIEEALTRHRGITEPVIKAFDEQFEAERLEGKHGPDAEPGHDPRAPYLKEHQFAERIERQVAAELGVDWAAYDAEVMGL